MWITSSTGGLVPYEYGALKGGSSQNWKVKDIAQEKWEAFAQDFSAHVEAFGLAGADGVVAVLEVEAEGDVSSVLEEGIADGAVDDIVDGRLLTYRRVVVGIFGPSNVVSFLVSSYEASRLVDHYFISWCGGMNCSNPGSGQSEY
jgi:hypothetical protein